MKNFRIEFSEKLTETAKKLAAFELENGFVGEGLQKKAAEWIEEVEANAHEEHEYCVVLSVTKGSNIEYRLAGFLLGSEKYLDSCTTNFRNISASYSAKVNRLISAMKEEERIAYEIAEKEKKEKIIKESEEREARVLQTKNVTAEWIDKFGSEYLKNLFTGGFEYEKVLQEQFLYTIFNAKKICLWDDFEYTRNTIATPTIEQLGKYFVWEKEYSKYGRVTKVLYEGEDGEVFMNVLVDCFGNQIDVCVEIMN